MTKKPTKSSPAVPPECYWGADVPMRVIRRFARAVAEKFQPDKIILFGSYAYGTPHADSDVDILVIMPCGNKGSKARRICWEVPAPFAMDLIVRSPEEMRWRLAEGDLFHTEIVSKGKVLYEKGHARVGAKGRSRLPARQKTRAGKRSLPRPTLLSLPAETANVLHMKSHLVDPPRLCP